MNRYYLAVSLVGILSIFVGKAPGADSDWVLVWEDDFEREEVGDAWRIGQDWQRDKRARIVDGRLRMEGVLQAVIKRPFKQDIRLEYEAQSLPGIPPCDMSVTLAIGEGVPLGYLLGFGARGNRANHLVGPGVGWADEDPPMLIEAGKHYHLVAQKEGKRITYTVNGTTIIDQTVEFPVGGPDFDQAGLLTWTGMFVDNVKVYERKTPHPDTPRTLSAMPETVMYRDGRKLKLREEVSPIIRKGVTAFNEGRMKKALELFAQEGSTLAGLVGRAYVLGDLDFIEPVYHDLFIELAEDFDAAAKANPGNPVLQDYALASLWFSKLYMGRSRAGGVAVRQLQSLGTENNPFYYKAKLYAARYKRGHGQEGGLPQWVREAQEEVRTLLELWPDNTRVLQQAGERVPWGERYTADTENHPEWAAYLREAYARAIAVMERLIETRQREDGQLGGGYGDDVEMMRTWHQVAAISTAAEGARAGIEKLAEGVWDNVLLKGYDKTLHDVEHSSEPSADALPGMLLLRHGDPLWVERNMESCHTIKNYFMGIDDHGYPRFKSSSIGALKYADPERAGADSGYHGRPMKHFLWAAWQGNDHAKDWLVGWADGWREMTMREIDGKIAGFPPLSLWYPTSSITAPYEGATWYEKRRNPWARIDMTQDLFLAAYWLTRDDKFLEPFHLAMQLASQGPYLRGSFEEGSREWQLDKMSHIPNNPGTEQTKVGLYRWLTGDTAYDEYTWHSAPTTLRFHMNSDLDGYARSFQGAAASSRYNLDMMTTEVMAMDRAGVPAALAIFGAYTGAISGMRDLATPTFAVTYDTPTTDFAALVQHASEKRLRLWLYNFDDEPMPIGLKLWRLTPGEYILEQGERLVGKNRTLLRYGWKQPEVVEVIHPGFGPTIEVPPSKVYAVDLRLKSEIDIPDQAPDLAVMPRDVAIDGGTAHVTVHNIGNGDAGEFSVAVTAVDSGRTLGSATLAGLAHPKDLVASTATVEIDLKAIASEKDLKVTIKYEGDVYDRNPHNNACRVTAP